MKKFLTIILTISFLILNAVGCAGINSFSYEGKFWYKDPTSSSNIYEQITYDVKVVSRTESNSTEVKNDYVALVIDQGEFVTTLTKDGDNYVYQTSLDVKGNYVYGENKVEVVNDVSSKVVFDSNSFKPLSSEKKSNKTTTLSLINSSYAIRSFGYDYKIVYAGEDANVTYVSNLYDNDGNKTEPTTVYNTYKDYNANVYLDNELLTLIPRTINFSTKESYTLTFNTIDVLTQKMHDMLLTTSTVDSKIDVKTLTFTYNNVINGESVVYAENSLKVVKVLISINDVFSGSAIELYYAIDHSNDRFRLIKAYTPLNDELGYMEYTIKTAVLNTNI